MAKDMAAIKTLAKKLKRAKGDDAAKIRAQMRRADHKGGLRSLAKAI